MISKTRTEAKTFYLWILPRRDLRSRRQGVHSPPHSINLSPRCPRLSDSPHHPLLVTHELEVAALETEVALNWEKYDAGLFP